jgi:biofilm PGA synthesis N-glycosyltransferase PgaC
VQTIHPSTITDASGQASSPRRLCVVIPAYNEELLIGRCVRSVLAAGVSPEDVYVVDDRSSDATAERVRAFEGVNLVSNPVNVGKLRGLQDAIARFDLLDRYELLSLLDADSHVAPEYFTAVLTRFADAPDAALVCGAPYSEPGNWVTAYRALEYAITFQVYRKGQDRLGVITVAPGCASTYRTSVLRQLDWDGRTLVEDMDLTIQIHRKRLGAVRYTPDATAYTQDPRTLREYIGQLTRWYSGTWQVTRLHKVPFGMQRIDAELALLLGEGLAYAVLVALLPVLIWFFPAALLSAFLFDQAIWLGLVVFTSVRMKRADILIYSPAFLLLRVINCVVLLQTFWSEIVRSRRLEQWFSVSRYREQVS